MLITGMDGAILGVEDLSAAMDFYGDFGLTQQSSGTSYAHFATLDGTEILLRKSDDNGLPAAVAPGSTIREAIWAVPSADHLKAIAAELARDRVVQEDDEGTIHSIDDDGYGIAFRCERRKKIAPAPNRLNIYGAEPARPMNTRIDFAEAVKPASVAHVVLFTPDVARLTRFYVERLQFRVSDRFRDNRGAFLRASGSTYHHNLFLIQGATRGLHHIAFPVTDFNEVVTGGQKMLEQGWLTKIGPGRHRIGSNYFWYFNSPCGGAMELTADMDRADDNWDVRDWDFVPENTAAWSTTINMPLR
ncbi:MULTISPECIES: VOC family protein [unclassified Beijerinckia]|uniref:VOC family protein n=1 Tax=unclassified Beijerinckia TaxID=2638183 RepID=UPI00089CDE0A|nr:MULTISPECIES: VOC family protein [unclassified Beijerinckia]MDH7799023.1 catechol 2,3-dioxygenase-like lactoylglutathione lyase family enzyme [Beijerinckia sp. GAS462]SED97592.1 Catechol-2,3-dioxygenase [Beijerinckia sp. 28-YEA-48]